MQNLRSEIYRQADVYVQECKAGVIAEIEDGYSFRYSPEYLVDSNAVAVSLTLPLTDIEYKSKTLFPFFDGLIPEGWLLYVAQDYWGTPKDDRFGILTNACRDCIGDVRIIGRNR